jgi:hypothetical protein
MYSVDTDSSQPSDSHRSGIMKVSSMYEYLHVAAGKSVASNPHYEGT